MSRRVLLMPVPPYLRGREGIPSHATFVVILDVDGVLEVKGSDEDVTATQHPEQFAQTVATAANAQYVGQPERGLTFDLDGTGWVGKDSLACQRHRLRDCEMCLEGHTDPLTHAGRGINFGVLLPRKAAA